MTRIYMTAYDGVFSFSRKDAIKCLEEVLLSCGSWDLALGKELKKECKGEGFYRDRKWIGITAKFPSLSDEYLNDRENGSEEINYIIKNLRG